MVGLGPVHGGTIGLLTHGLSSGSWLVPSPDGPMARWPDGPMARWPEAPVTMLDGGDFNGAKAYKDSKVCDVMLMKELHRRFHKDRMTKKKSHLRQLDNLPTRPTRAL